MSIWLLTIVGRKSGVMNAFGMEFPARTQRRVRKKGSKERLPDYNHELVNQFEKDVMRNTHSPTLVLNYDMADKYLTKENARDYEQRESSAQRQSHCLLEGV